MLVRRAAAIAPTVLAALVAAAGTAAAQSSLGIGVAEQAPASNSGLFGGFFAWVALQQSAFYEAMRAALTTMRDGGSGAPVLVGLSFLYGILHAAGPGHGKVVISSYMLANETALRRGIALSFAASLVQALSAIVIVGLGFLVLRQLAVSQTDTTRFFEIASYSLVIALGLWLLVRKARALRPAAPRPAALSAAAVHDHHHAPGEVCATCGHAHMPMPDQVAGPMKLRDAAAVVLSVGLRPCTGALIVLTFAFLNGLWAAGLVSVLAMALGTAITVSALATLAVTAKNVALRLSGSSALSGPVSHAIEIGGALLIIAMGVALLGGALGA
ncbi:MAG: nickel/cobalt transporter [Roseitalea sp.]|nr:nickel/cobalt transporter [Roseitalea sp.]MBO6722426.1 nickel/cobalt transporter [Roseitalea sp.]MBO6741960.1 nickel/cobalt transporter [Roseitalea sp.]